MDSHDVKTVQCPNCGMFRITWEAWDDLRPLQGKYRDRRHLISGYLREMTDRGLDGEIMTADRCCWLLESLSEPTFMDRLDKVLLSIYRLMSSIGARVMLPLHPAVGYVRSEGELYKLVRFLEDRGYLQAVKADEGARCTLTWTGIARAESLLEASADTKQVFVAMYFDADIVEVYDKHIARAVQDTGYAPLIIANKEHNDDVCDQIIAEIRRSRFLIADFTGNRGGVYFEAGFALGLGLPVIWTCRQDTFQQGVHFDVNHYNFIVWSSGEELYESLRNRIRATIG